MLRNSWPPFRSLAPPWWSLLCFLRSWTHCINLLAQAKLTKDWNKYHACIHSHKQTNKQTTRKQTNHKQTTKPNQAKPNIYIRNIFRYQIGNHFLVHRLHAQWGRGDERGPLAARQNPNAITKTARQRRMWRMWPVHYDFQKKKRIWRNAKLFAQMSTN